MQLDLVHALHPDRLKGPQPHMQSYEADNHTPRANPLQHLGREVQSRRRSRRRTRLPGINRLIPLPVAAIVSAMNIGRQWYMADPVESRKEIRHRTKSQPPLPKLPMLA